MNKKNKNSLQIISEYIQALVAAVILAVLIRGFVYEPFKIPSESMVPTLLVGDHIFVARYKYGLRVPFTKIWLKEFDGPKRGDVMVFSYPEDEDVDFIKRVVGVPGDVVEVRDKDVYVNDALADTSHIQHTDPTVHLDRRDNFGPVTVPGDSYFVMGDNRDQSLDSRFWGFVKENKIRGKAFLIYWSWNSDEIRVRWDRIGRRL